MVTITKNSILSCRRMYKFESAGKIEIIQYNEENNTVYIEGWSLCHTETPPSVPEALFVISRGVCVHEIREFPIHRQDVEDYFGLTSSPQNRHRGTGFTFALENISKEEIEGLTFLAVSRNNWVYPLDYQTATSQVEICGNCNMRCPQCPNVRLSGFNRQELSPKEFRLALEVIERSRFVCFDGFGESFLNNQIEAITAMIPWFKELKFHTNGILLDKRTDFLLQYAPPIYQCIVSLDSLRSERYSVFRPGGNLKNVLKSMRALKNKREGIGQMYPLIVPNLTINEQNYDELPAFLDLALQLDKKLEIALPFDPDGVVHPPIRNNDAASLYEMLLPRHNWDKIHIAINRLLDDAAKRHAEVMLQGFISGELPVNQVDALGAVVKVKSIQACPMTNGTTVQSDGKGMICPWQTRPVFNWKLEATMDPMKTRREQEVIRAIKEGRIPAECSGSCCPYVGRRQSSEPYEPVSGNFAGGWQIY